MRSRIVKIFIGLTGMIAILVMLQEYRMTHGGSKLFNLTASKLLMKNPEEYLRKEDHMRRDDVIKDSDEMDEDDVDDRTPFHIVSGMKAEEQGDEDEVGEDLEEEGTVSKESEETPTHLGAMTDQDNNWFKSTNPEMIEHVTDLEDDLNALFPPEDIKELEEDESWMWEAYDIDDPCSICLAPVSSRPLIALASAPALASIVFGILWNKQLEYTLGLSIRTRGCFMEDFKQNLWIILTKIH
ncbi:uncharacterized protein [Ptychodera flava]|uniref:uncharacterized protein n=1 Tax=Ptychodera flava TaxID=63121 RepID=UPI00396A3169